MGLPREKRLRLHGEFVEAQRDGVRVVTRHFVLLVYARTGATGQADHAPARLGLIVSRKVGGAVVRNRVKRICRAAFRVAPPFPTGVDLLAIPRPGAELLKSIDVLAELEGARKRVDEALAQAKARAGAAKRPASGA